MEEQPTYTTNSVHTSLVGIHLQDPAPDWTQAVPRFPNGATHEFFQTQSAREAKQIDPTCKTIHRHYVAHQDPYLYAQNKPQAARDYFNAFVDGSFMNDAPYINMICDLNEYFGGESPEERAQKTAWTQALARVWEIEYRNRQGLEHIRLVLARTAVGNDIPLEVAQAAYDYDALLSYHPYVPVNNGVILGQGQQKAGLGNPALYKAAQSTMIEGEIYIINATEHPEGTRVAQSDVEWTYFSGRWTQMDAYYLSEGIKVDWVFTEIGPVLYTEDNAGNIHLNAGAGWRWHEVYNASITGYISALEYWAQRTAQWNASNDNRALGGNMFTTNQPHNGWEYFRTNQPELNQIADYFRNWTPDIDPPPTDDRQALYEAGKENDVIFTTSEYALHRHIASDGLIPTSNEFNVTLSDGVQYVCQKAKDGQERERIYRFPVGHYGDDDLIIEYY